MFTFKPKKVFEKLNKMDRKQAYTLGAIAVVSIVALLMLVSALTSTNDDSFEGMATRGYDLANMPFATDEAEKYLLAAKYPDMQENGSTLLYSSAEKEARQEEDAQEMEEDNSLGEENFSQYDDNTSAARSDNGGYAGYSGGGRGRTKTEIGQLSSTGMATAGGSVLNATAPTGDFMKFQKSEDRGNGAPTQLKTGNARQALAQFRQGSRAAATFKENRMTGARKAVIGGTATGSDAITKDGVDMSKVQEGGLTLDTSAPSSSTDLNNLDKKVAEAAKKAEQKKKEEEKTPWWMEMLQGLAKQALNSLVGSVMEGVGDSIKGTIAGNKAARSARNKMGQELASKDWSKLSAADKNHYKETMNKMGLSNKDDKGNHVEWSDDDYGAAWGRTQGTKELAKMMRNSFSSDSAATTAWEVASEKSQEESARLRQTRASTEQKQTNGGSTPPLCSDGKTDKTWNAEKKNWNDC